MAGRHARLSIRDELLLLALDEDHGWKPRIHVPTLGVGLVGATLVDLLLDGEVNVLRGHVAVRDPDQQNLIRDPLAGRLLAYLLPVRDWVQLRHVIADTAPGFYERLLQHLVEEGRVAKVKRALGKRYEPADIADLVRARALPRMRVRNVARGALVPDLATDALCALLRTLHLEETLYLELAPADVGSRLDAIARQIGASSDDPCSTSIPDVLAAVEATAGDLAVAVYR